MRQKIKMQIGLGSSSIERMQIDIGCRDDIPALLFGLQFIYLNRELREKVLTLLENSFSEKVSLDHGRPGMDLWRILVLGVIRLGANVDYDRLQDLANEHASIRVMLMTDLLDEEYWKLETIQDNVRFLTPEVLDQINLLVVKFGHELLKKKGRRKLRTRCTV